MRPDPTPARLPHDELSPFAQLADDGRAAQANLHLDGVRARINEPVPSLAYADFPKEVHKPRIEVTEAAQRIANALHLHLD